jgi:plastocyanin
MTDGRRFSSRLAAVEAAILIVVLVGAGASYLLLRDRSPQPADSARTQARAPGAETTTPSGAATLPPSERQPASPNGAGPAAQTARITSTENGYEPNKISVRAGSPVRLTFVRTTDKTCGTEVIFPALNIRRPLPLKEPVTIEFTPAKSGEIAFACGMNMFTGAVVVQ